MAEALWLGGRRGKVCRGSEGAPRSAPPRRCCGATAPTWAWRGRRRARPGAEGTWTRRRRACGGPGESARGRGGNDQEGTTRLTQRLRGRALARWDRGWRALGARGGAERAAAHHLREAAPLVAGQQLQQEGAQVVGADVRHAVDALRRSARQGGVGAGSGRGRRWRRRARNLRMRCCSSPELETAGD